MIQQCSPLCQDRQTCSSWVQEEVLAVDQQSSQRLAAEVDLLPGRWHQRACTPAHSQWGTLREVVDQVVRVVRVVVDQRAGGNAPVGSSVARTREEVQAMRHSLASLHD